MKSEDAAGPTGALLVRRWHSPHYENNTACTEHSLGHVQSGKVQSIYFTTGNVLAVYQKFSTRTLQVLGHKSQQREIDKFLEFTNILLKNINF
jgi:hypothetical protein